MQTLLIITLFVVSFTANVLAATQGEKYVLNEEKKYTRLCKKENKNGRDNLKSVKQDNAFASVLLFECYKKEASSLKPTNPTGAEYEIYSLLDSRIAFYNNNINEINNKFKLDSSLGENTVEEIIIEKRIFIKREGNERITEELILEQKATTPGEAKLKCRQRGFNENSKDPLEKYLFDECIKDLGFAPESKAYSNATNLKIEKVNKQAEGKKQKAAVKQNTASKTANKPASASVAANPEVKSQEPKPEITKVVEDATPVKEAPKKPEVAELRRNLTSGGGRVVCRVDAYGSRVCMYEPRLKKNEGTKINNLYLE